MDLDNIYQYLLTTDGVNQSQRSLPALDPASIPVDERSPRDLIAFLLALSEQIRFYQTENQPQGDWRPFFEYFTPGGVLISQAGLNGLLTDRKDWPPHLALLMAFFKVFAHAQQDLNTLTSRHLRYFYQEVLQLQRRSARADQVHVLFEPSKNAAPVLLPAGTLLDAGKNAEGKPLRYTLDSEIIVNHATIPTLKSVYVDRNSDGKAMVFKTDDVTLVKSDSGTGWRPFGTRQLSLSPENRNMTPAQLGFAIASPTLLLAEGERTITLLLTLQTSLDPPPPPQILAPFITAELTGEKTWLQPETLEAELTGPDTLKIVLHLPAALPAVTGYQEAVHLAGLRTSWPALRIQINPEAFQLETFGAFNVQWVELTAEVSGVRNLVFQNDQSLQAPGNTILPFANQPSIGANFYIGSHEVFSKSLTSLSVQLEWQDPPANFTNHYSAYNTPDITNAVFTTDIYLLAAKNWNTRLLFNQSLFNSVDPAALRTLKVSPSVFAAQTAGSGFSRRPDADPVTNYHLNQQQGFVKLVLTGPTRDNLGNLPANAPFDAFGHKTFPSVYAEQAIALSKFTGGGTPPALPLAPYTPALKSVSLDYSTTEAFKPDGSNGIEQFFTIDIFGPKEIKRFDTARLVPELPGNGALYIGLQQAAAPQLISLLFQLLEGSTPGDVLLRSQDLLWSYLANETWQPLVASDVVEESTGGLQKPGLVRLNLGADASNDATSMPKGWHWIRLAVAAHADGAGALEAILPQAARATFVTTGHSDAGLAAHFALPLPGQSISKLVTKVAGIKTVQQPYPSFGGRTPESDPSFFQRISERLRHKNRSATVWDYERLVLEGFPEVFKVKCLPHTNEENQISPGKVRLVIVPDFRKRPVGDPLQPRSNASLLRDIEDHIALQYASPFVTLSATNPSYETLLVDCKVAFRSGFDPGYYAAQLNAEMKRFLSPWAYEDGKDIIFGGKIYRTELLAFVEGRPYVDYVVDFQVYHRFSGAAGGGIGQMKIGQDFIVGVTPTPTVGTNASTIGVDFVVGEPVEIAAATRPDAILVSNHEHRMQALQADGFLCSGVTNIGIGQMIIGIDFVPVS